jgi:hypothetical protein
MVTTHSGCQASCRNGLASLALLIGLLLMLAHVVPVAKVAHDPRVSCSCAACDPFRNGVPAAGHKPWQKRTFLRSSAR